MLAARTSGCLPLPVRAVWLLGRHFTTLASVPIHSLHGYSLGDMYTYVTRHVCHASCILLRSV